jgi:hypothetical protein
VGGADPADTRRRRVAAAVFDVTAPQYAAGLALGARCLAHDTWADALAAYDAERRVPGDTIAASGVRRPLGLAEVERAPGWAVMSEGDFEAWWAAAVSGLVDPCRMK